MCYVTLHDRIHQMLGKINPSSGMPWAIFYASSDTATVRSMGWRQLHFCREYTGCLTYWMFYFKSNDKRHLKLIQIHRSSDLSWGISCASSDTAAARLYSGSRISAENTLDI